MNVVNDTEDTRPLSHRVVMEVADEMGTDPTQLEPLFDSIDPDALDKLFDARTEATERGVTQLSFTYEGHQIVVERDRSVEVVAAT